MTFYSILGTEYVLNPAGIFQSTQPPGKQDKLNYRDIRVENEK